MAQPLDNAALDQLFDKARTHNKWQPREVPDELLKKIVEHMKWGPTSANCSPARIVFVTSQLFNQRGCVLELLCFAETGDEVDTNPGVIPVAARVEEVGLYSHGRVSESRPRTQVEHAAVGSPGSLHPDGVDTVGRQ